MKKFLALICVLLLISVVACAKNEPAPEQDVIPPVATPTPTVEIPEPTPEPTPEFAPESRYAMTFEYEAPLTMYPMPMLNNTHVAEFGETETFDGYTLGMYVRAGTDDEQLTYAYIEIKSVRFDLGPAGMYQLFAPMDMTFDGDVTYYTGASDDSVLYIIRDDIPYRIFEGTAAFGANYAAMRFEDIDGDGASELFGVNSADNLIMKLDSAENRMLYTPVTELLHCTSAGLVLDMPEGNDEILYQAYYGENSELGPYIYTLQNGEFILTSHSN